MGKCDRKARKMYSHCGMMGMKILDIKRSFKFNVKNRMREEP